MNQDMERFLNLRHLPGRLTAEQAAGYLGVSPHEMPILMARGLLKPLGHPAINAQKYFLAATLQELKRDEKWFGKACDAIGEYWRNKNARKGSPDDPDELTGRSSGSRRSLSVTEY
jgi:hypothetical protein